ncbi:MAG: hypothetical protein R3Y36_08415 [Spirochaetales bacterium]
MNILSLIENLPANIVYMPHDTASLNFTEVIAGDLMADMLISQGQNCLLITGLATEQILRTADMLGVCVVLLVNEKLPSMQMKELAEDMNIPLLATALPLFETCVAVSKLLNS